MISVTVTILDKQIHHSEIKNASVGEVVVAMKFLYPSWTSIEVKLVRGEKDK